MIVLHLSLCPPQLFFPPNPAGSPNAMNIEISKLGSYILMGCQWDITDKIQNEGGKQTGMGTWEWSERRQRRIWYIELRHTERSTDSHLFFPFKYLLSYEGGGHLTLLLETLAVSEHSSLNLYDFLFSIGERISYSGSYHPQWVWKCFLTTRSKRQQLALEVEREGQAFHENIGVVRVAVGC